jgi:dihydroorotase
MAFEEEGINLFSEQGRNCFKKFLCDIGPDFYGIKKPFGTFELVKSSQKIDVIKTEIGEIIPLPLGMVKESERDNITIPWKIENIKRS